MYSMYVCITQFDAEESIAFVQGFELPWMDLVSE